MKSTGDADHSRSQSGLVLISTMSHRLFVVVPIMSDRKRMKPAPHYRSLNSSDMIHDPTLSSLCRIRHKPESLPPSRTSVFLTFGPQSNCHRVDQAHRRFLRETSGRGFNPPGSAVGPQHSGTRPPVRLALTYLLPCSGCAKLGLGNRTK
jgi:hypothetical protein